MVGGADQGQDLAQGHVTGIGVDEGDQGHAVGQIADLVAGAGQIADLIVGVGHAGGRDHQSQSQGHRRKRRLRENRKIRENRGNRKTDSGD